MAKEKPPKVQKGSVLEEKKRETKTPEYSQEEQSYLGKLQKRLEDTKNRRDQSHEEFDGLTYQQYLTANEAGANTYLKSEKEKHVRTFQTGTLRTKMLAFLSTFQSLNLKADITAFDQQDILINSLGDAMEDIIEKTEELENDEELRVLREYELLKHGHVFIEDMWQERWETQKILKKGFYGKKTGVSWAPKKVKADGRPRRNILSGLSVYLGDLTKYFIEDQPYLFTVETLNWEDAKQLYESWEMWSYVTKKKRKFSGNVGGELMANAWRLLSGTQEGEVEKVVYQDESNNEIQILLNGVPMLPMGFPLTEVSPDGEYTIAQQNLEPIRHNFAYGKSFIFKNKNIVAVLDEMMKLAVLKTQKSFLPPYLNLSNRIISKDVFMPGRISRGIGKGDITPVSEQEVKGVTASEFNMIQEVIRTVDRNTASQTFTGAREPGGKVTATQIIELQRQAKVMMGLLTLAASLLEKKLASKRLTILLAKWFDPVDEVFDKARKALKNKYRTVARTKLIEGEGLGVRMVVPTEEIPPSEVIREREEKLKRTAGYPVRMTLINPRELKKAKITWVITVNPRDKRSSELSKLMFRAMIQDAVALGLTPDPDYLKRRFAQIWEEDAAKMFRSRPETQLVAPTEPPPAPQVRVTTPKITPEIKVPGGEGRAPGSLTR